MVDKNKKTNYWWSLLGLVIAFLIIALLQLVLNKKDNSFDSGVKLGLLAYSKTLPQKN